jgi:hypothetical protein
MPKSDYDFFRIEGEKPIYMEIEAALMEIGLEAERNPSFIERITGKKPDPKNPWAGLAYKVKALKAAGWCVDKDGSYTNDPDRASQVMLKISKVLDQTRDPEKVLELLEGA